MEGDPFDETFSSATVGALLIGFARCERSSSRVFVIAVLPAGWAFLETMRKTRRATLSRN